MRQGGGKVNYGAAKFAKRLFYLLLVGASTDRLWLCGDLNGGQER